MSLAPTLRPVHPSEAEALACLRVEAMRESLEHIGRFDESRARQRFLANFSPASTSAIMVGHQVAGFFVLRSEADCLLLEHLYLRPAFQGRGIGSLLLAKVFAEADAKQQAVKVGALRESRANAFYLRSGFVLVERSEHDNHYQRLPRIVSASG